MVFRGASAGDVPHLERSAAASISGGSSGGPSDLGSLARLSELERHYGSGGADDEVDLITAGYDKKDGFFISDREKAHFLLKIGVQLQFRYTYKGRDRRGDAVGADEVGTRDVSIFELERLRVKFSGHILDPSLTYLIQLDGDSDGGSGSPPGGVKAIDAYVLYHAGEYFGGEGKLLSIGAGQWKAPFLRQETTSSSALQMVDRSLANEFFNIDRTLGVWVQGELGSLYYAAAVTNGFDSANFALAAVDQVPGFVFRLVANILGEESPSKYEESNIKCAEEPFFSIGASFATDQNNGTSAIAGQEKFKAYTFGLDTAFKVSVLSLQAEYMGRWLDYRLGNTAAGGESSGIYCHGFYVQGGVFLVPEVLEVAGRVSAIWTDSGPNSGNAFEAGPGLSWYISHSHKVKLQTDVMFFDISADLPNQTESIELTSGSLSSSGAGYEAGEQGVMWRTQFQLAF